MKQNNLNHFELCELILNFSRGTVNIRDHIINVIEKDNYLQVTMILSNSNKKTKITSKVNVKKNETVKSLEFSNIIRYVEDVVLNKLFESSVDSLMKSIFQPSYNYGWKHYKE